MPEEKEPEEQEVILEMTTREEYLMCACQALNATSEFNAMTKVAEAMQKRIVRRCVRIIDEMVKEMHDELFEDDEEE